MSIFYDNVQLYEDGANQLEEKRQLQKDMASVVSNIKEQYKTVETRDITKMRNFLYYYGEDWTNDPFEAEEDANPRCRLAQKLRPAKEAIDVLREFGRLDLLKPFIDALEEDGIHLKVDEYNNFTNINSELSAMNKYQEQIDEADEKYKDEIKAKAISAGAATEKGYDTIARSILRTRSGKKKAIDKCNELLQDTIANTLLDTNTLTDCVQYIKGVSNEN